MTREEYLKLVDFHYMASIDWVSDSGDETKPIQITAGKLSPVVKIESEEEKRERLWRAVQEFSSN